jgi:quinol-cytochrome oxidoreductase complex cytochrome b subunit
VILHQEPIDDPVSEGDPPLRRARHFGLGVLVGLVVACPTFVIEEAAFGKPLIDHYRSAWWVVPAAIMALGFLVGGMIGGSQSRRAENAFVAGGLVAAVTVGLIFIADLLRRHSVGKPLNVGVEKLWVLAAIGAIVAGGIGGVIGYFRTSPSGRTPV